MSTDSIEAEIEHWLDAIVIGLNLCPFAKGPRDQGRVRIHTCLVTSHEEFLLSLTEQLQVLSQLPSSEIETTLFVTPNLFSCFDEYLDALTIAEELIKVMELEEQFQLASFHPEYQFDGTRPEDNDNLTNRSPYPIFHILRQESISKAIEQYGDTSLIPKNNVKKMNNPQTVELIKKVLNEA